MIEVRPCGKETPHFEHEWGEDWADMGIIWRDCPGVRSEFHHHFIQTESGLSRCVYCGGGVGTFCSGSLDTPPHPM